MEQYGMMRYCPREEKFGGPIANETADDRSARVR
jgi:hypothetical protein